MQNCSFSSSSWLIYIKSEKNRISLPLGWTKSKLSALAQTVSSFLGIIMGSFSCVCHQISPPLQTRCLLERAMEFKSGKVKVSFAQVMIAVGGKMTALRFIEFQSSMPSSFIVRLVAGQTMENMQNYKLLHMLYTHSIQLSFLKPLKLLCVHKASQICI